MFVSADGTHGGAVQGLARHEERVEVLMKRCEGIRIFSVYFWHSEGCRGLKNEAS